MIPCKHFIISRKDNHFSFDAKMSTQKTGSFTKMSTQKSFDSTKM